MALRAMRRPYQAGRGFNQNRSRRCPVLISANLQHRLRIRDSGGVG